MLEIRKIDRKMSHEDIARAYVTITSAMNGITLTPSEVDLLSFCICNGGVMKWEVRQAFTEKRKISKNSLYNLQHSLKVKGFILKGGEIHKELFIDPSKGVGLIIRMDAKEDR